MNESPGLPTLSLTCFVLGVLDVQLFKWYQNGNIAQEVDVLSTALSFCFGGNKFSTYLYCFYYLNAAQNFVDSSNINVYLPIKNDNWNPN